MLRYALFFYLNFQLLITIVANSELILGKFNTLLFINEVFLNCPLKRAKLIINLNVDGLDIFGRLPCKNSIKQLQLLLSNYATLHEDIKEDIFNGWSKNNVCKTLLSFTDNFFKVTNSTVCSCFVDVENDVITRSSFEIVKICELLFQKWRLCSHIKDLESFIQPNKKIRMKRTDSELLINLQIKHF